MSREKVFYQSVQVNVLNLNHCTESKIKQKGGWSQKISVAYHRFVTKQLKSWNTVFLSQNLKIRAMSRKKLPKVHCELTLYFILLVHDAARLKVFHNAD